MSIFYRNKTLNVFLLLSEDIDVCLKYCIEMLSVIINWLSVFSACPRLSA